MYGIEEATGLGGLAAQAPAGDIYLPAAARIRFPGAMLAGDPTAMRGGQRLPYSLSNSPLGGQPQVSYGGRQVERPASQMMASWREILDFHNSPAPWILIGILAVYFHNHVSYKRRGQGL